MARSFRLPDGLRIRIHTSVPPGAAIALTEITVTGLERATDLDLFEVLNLVDPDYCHTLALLALRHLRGPAALHAALFHS